MDIGHIERKLAKLSSTLANAIPRVRPRKDGSTSRDLLVSNNGPASGGTSLEDCACGGGVAAFRSKPSTTSRSTLDHLLSDARDPENAEQSHTIFELYDAVRNHLLGTLTRRNRVSDAHREIPKLPAEERVSFLKDACWWLEQAHERLPGVDRKDIVSLGRMTQSVGSNFDLDDNILFLPTEIILIHKKTGEERGVSTTEFAEIRGDLGERGEWKDFTTDGRSFRGFRDCDPEVFLEDMKAAVASGRRGPSWNAFVDACSTELGAKHCTIITARGHYPESVVQALEWLRDEGYIKHVPPVENIYAVSAPGLAEVLGSDARNPSDGKAKVMEALLDDVQRTAIGPSAVWILNRDGTGRRPMHLWHFSDDDHATYLKTLEVLGEGTREGRWSDVKIIVSYTGELEDEPKRTEVIQSNGTPRARTHAEAHEDDAILRKDALPPLAHHPECD